MLANQGKSFLSIVEISNLFRHSSLFEFVFSSLILPRIENYEDVQREIDELKPTHVLCCAGLRGNPNVV